LQLAIGRLRREQQAMAQQPMPDDAETTEGQDPDYADPGPWHAPVQYPWLYGWPNGARAYSEIYPGRR